MPPGPFQRYVQNIQFIYFQVLQNVFGINVTNHNSGLPFSMDGSHDQRTPEERRSDQKREIINAKQLYSNGHLIETVADEEGLRESNDEDDMELDLEQMMVPATMRPPSQQPAFHPYLDRNRMTTVMEPAPDSGAIVLGVPPPVGGEVL